MIVKAMVKRLPDTLIGRRDRALLLFGFSTGMRRSELVALTVADLERAPEGILVHIRKSKTDQEGAGQTVPVLRGSKLKAIEALDAWLDAAAITHGLLFRSIDRWGNVSPHGLTGRAFADVVKRQAAAAGFDPSRFSGHSVRAGLVTTALAKGADVMKIMDITRHTSVATLKIYDRRAKAFKDHAGKAFL